MTAPAPVIVWVDEETATAGTPDEIRASLRAVILAGRYERPLRIGPGATAAGMFTGGILVDAGPEVYEALAARFTAQAEDAISGPKPDHGLAAVLLADARTARALAQEAS
jgi:hypothetical protein